MKQDILLEAPVFTVEAALMASETGVNRLELCSSFAEGGETPDGVLTLDPEIVERFKKVMKM